MARKRKKRKTPAHFMAISLRPRIDSAWKGQLLARQSQAAISASLDELARGVKKDFFVTTVLRAFVDAPRGTQEHLRDLLPVWLKDRGHLDVLKEVVANPALELDMLDQALIWLKVARVDLSTVNIATPENLFFDAYLVEDGSQSNLIILWYTNRHRERVSGLAFLIDHTPPWQGALKEVLRYPTRSSNQAIEQFIDGWNETVTDRPLLQIKGEEAKEKLLHALKTNQNFGLRLPQSLINERDYFAKNVMVWFRASGTSSFTMKDFTKLSQKGTTPESLIRFEEQLRQRLRLDDGEEALRKAWMDEDGVTR